MKVAAEAMPNASHLFFNLGSSYTEIGIKPKLKQRKCYFFFSCTIIFDRHDIISGQLKEAKAMLERYFEIESGKVEPHMVSTRALAHHHYGR